MSEFDAATAAVQAALDAGARYADARVMHRRYESMTARNGDVEDLDPGRGRRASACARSSARAGASTPCPTCPTRRRARAGAQATAIAAASAPGRPRAARARRRPRRSPARGRASARSTRSACRSPTRATCSSAPRRRWREHGADIAEAMYQIWDTAKWFVSSEGHRIDQRVRECGAGIMATSIGDGETQRRSYPAARGQYGTRGLGAGRRDRPRGPRRPCRRRVAGAAVGAAVPERRDDADPRRPSRWRCRSTSPSATPSSSTASSAGRRPTPARRGSTSPSSARCSTARS